VFADVDNRMRIAQDEIFGPVACLIPFNDEADAVRQANDIAYGLSSYVWTENIGRAHRVAAAIEAGMCFVNSQNVRDLRQPFGGTKASGTGREGGTWSYEVFCEERCRLVSATTTSRAGASQERPGRCRGNPPRHRSGWGPLALAGP
jgi:5-carboxymethyl-2-hydroxymuconic-semialdehyde dehydrogenase